MIVVGISLSQIHVPVLLLLYFLRDVNTQAKNCSYINYSTLCRPLFMVTFPLPYKFAYFLPYQLQACIYGVLQKMVSLMRYCNHLTDTKAQSIGNKHVHILI